MIYNVKPFNDAVYPEINDIWLWSNRITDISPISSLYNLKMIAIGENDIDDFTPLLKLEELSEVYIDQEQSGKNSEFFNELRNKGCAVIIMN